MDTHTYTHTQNSYLIVSAWVWLCVTGPSDCTLVCVDCVWGVCLWNWNHGTILWHLRLLSQFVNAWRKKTWITGNQIIILLLTNPTKKAAAKNGLILLMSVVFTSYSWYSLFLCGLWSSILVWKLLDTSGNNYPSLSCQCCMTKQSSYFKNHSEEIGTPKIDHWET